MLRHPVDGRPKHKEKTSAKPVVHSPIGSFGRGVQLSPISTRKTACETSSQAVFVLLAGALTHAIDSLLTVKDDYSVHLHVKDG